MLANIDLSLVDWSRAQFALTAMYHWLFVPITLGLGVIQAIMETIYFKTGNVFWRDTAKFWMKLFGINFAIGVATGLILEFEFGTNWSNYSWFVGDIFGAPLAIEGILAFFMEATFIAVMFFGWNKVSPRFHLISTWLTIIGATLSALWILIANAWMQFPEGMQFNPDTVRNEMVDFFAVALSPVAINKFFHTVLSGWVTGAVFVLGVSSWYLLKRRHIEFALGSIKVATWFGLIASILILWTGDGSAYQVAQRQPMKLAAMEGLYHGGTNQSLVAVGVLKSDATYKDVVDPFVWKLEIPSMLSILAERDSKGFVPGLSDLLEKGYTKSDGTVIPPAVEMMKKGKVAVKALGSYRDAKKRNDVEAMSRSKALLEENYNYFGYGYINNVEELIPPIGLVFYSFHIMVLLGGFFIFLFLLFMFLKKERIVSMRFLHFLALLAIPLAFVSSQAGWIVAEVGRQPWVIQDILPTSAAVSNLQASSVQLTFFIFLILFTLLLVVELRIMLAAIKEGPELH